MSLVGNSNLISKVYFPRMIIPASSIITSLVDLAISLVILAIMFYYLSLCARHYHRFPSFFHTDCIHCSIWRRTLYNCIKCQVPGLPLYYSFHCPVRALYNSCRFQQQYNPREMAAVLFLESYGRRGGWFPVVHFGRAPAFTGFSYFHCDFFLFLWLGHLVFQENRKKLCR